MDYSGVKLAWTVDQIKAGDFYERYQASTDMILVNVNWNSEGFFCYIPQEIQMLVLNTLGKERYIKKPKEGTNPRGIEISREALKLCVDLSEKKGYYIPIHWKVPEELVSYNPYTRWIEIWAKD